MLAPIGRDAPASAELLRRVGLDAEVCKSLSDLVKDVNAGAAAVLVAEEALFGENVLALIRLDTTTAALVGSAVRGSDESCGATGGHQMAA